MGAVLRSFGASLRDGLRLFWLAPFIVAIVIVPEFLQHVAEIRIGMFDGKSAFAALSDDPRRMIWGYIKIGGLLLGLLAVIRFWGAREREQKWWHLRAIAWRNLGIAAALLVITAIPAELARGAFGDSAADIIGLVILILTLPLIPLLIAGMIGDRTVGLGSIYKTGWLAALRIIVFSIVIWVPLQWVHGATHGWAMGETDAVVWALMIFDSFVVGALVAFTGTAMHHAYAYRRKGMPGLRIPAAAVREEHRSR